jgi:hypothetical protein
MIPIRAAAAWRTTTPRSIFRHGFGAVSSGALLERRGRLSADGDHPLHLYAFSGSIANHVLTLIDLSHTRDPHQTGSLPARRRDPPPKTDRRYLVMRDQ